jgi:hypothetical protein
MYGAAGTDRHGVRIEEDLPAGRDDLRDAHRIRVEAETRETLCHGMLAFQCLTARNCS